MRGETIEQPLKMQNWKAAAVPREAIEGLYRNLQSKRKGRDDNAGDNCIY